MCHTRDSATVRIACATTKIGHNQMNEQFLKSRLNRFLYREEEKETAEDEMLGWCHQFNRHELGQTLGDGEGQGSLVRVREAFSP